jgi:hypothetical protein
MHAAHTLLQDEMAAAIDIDHDENVQLLMQLAAGQLAAAEDNQQLRQLIVDQGAQQMGVLLDHFQQLRDADPDQRVRKAMTSVHASLSMQYDTPRRGGSSSSGGTGSSSYASPKSSLASGSGQRAQLKQHGDGYIPNTSLVLGKLLGRGSFGDVHEVRKQRSSSSSYRKPALTFLPTRRPHIPDSKLWQ